ncbi:MAG: hypothetical protein Q7S52_05735, partial [bacterium]|nr:hypothetical protein [bacterium]
MTDFQPVSDQQLARSYWYFTHRERLKRMLTIALIVLCIGLWGYSIIRLSYLLLVEEPKTQAAVADLPRNNGARARDFLQPLEDITITTTNVFTTTDKQTDFYAHIQNPNREYAALSFTYSFAYDGGETPVQKGYLLPG